MCLAKWGAQKISVVRDFLDTLYICLAGMSYEKGEIKYDGTQMV